MYILRAAVDCGSPPILLDSIPVIDALQVTTYGGKAGYRCIDGRWFGRHRHTELAACTADALWESGGETDPSRMPSCIREWITISSVRRPLHHYHFYLSSKQYKIMTNIDMQWTGQVRQQSTYDCSPRKQTQKE